MNSTPSRRKFLQKSAQQLTALSIASIPFTACSNPEKTNNSATSPIKTQKNVDFKPLVISTWKNEKANSAAWDIIKNGGSALDAVEAGAKVPESDASDQSVGYGGRPDREGIVTLDDCIMDEKGNAGSVCFLPDIKHPISVARKVMEKTPHVMLAGVGALQFALEQGFEKENLLTEESRKEYEEWKKESKYEPIINIEAHDTIGILAIDKKGNISGACTTSGLAYKMHGRVGDSPIIGAGLFVDNEIGGAVATGMGEFVLRSLGSFLVVELMRQGRTPFEACKEAVMRIVDRQDYKNIQVGYIAINKAGEYGSFAIQDGFMYVIDQENRQQVFDVQSFI